MKLAVVGAVLFAPLVCSAAGAEQSAQDILKASGIKGGLIVQLGCGSAELTTSLRADDAFVVQGLES